MSRWSSYAEYIIRLVFVLVGVVSLALAILSGGTLALGFIFITVVCLILAIKYRGLKLTVRGYTLEFGESLPDGFEGLIEHAEKSSKTAAESLREVRMVSNSNDPYHDLSEIIDSGIKTRDQSGADLLISELKTSIQSKNYLEKAEDRQMKVVRFEDDILHVNSGGKEGLLKRGMQFRIYRKTVELADEESEDVEDQIGIATVELASKQTTKMRMREWLKPLDDPEITAIRENKLKGEKLFADIVVSDPLKQTPKEELEEAYQQLNTLRSER